MSNQFGLILSFIFLSIFLTLSSEIISYQSFATTFDNQSIHIVNYIQKSGWNDQNVKDYCEKYEFESYEHKSEYIDNYIHHTIIFNKEYNSKIDDSYDKIVTRKYEIFKKR